MRAYLREIAYKQFTRIQARFKQIYKQMIRTAANIIYPPTPPCGSQVAFHGLINEAITLQDHMPIPLSESFRPVGHALKALLCARDGGDIEEVKFFESFWNA